jgi:DNA-binding PucR family transcriptional regulator
VHDAFIFDAGRITTAVTSVPAGDEGPLPMLAFGRAASGLDGFRRTHLDAVQAQRVATIGGATGQVISYSDPDVSIAALLTADLEDTRAWVAATLAGLADDTEQHERLRETLRLFLHHDSSYTATAEAMLMHKNSVKYRVESAEKILGHKVRSDRQAIELALTACHWLGRVVLQDQLRASPCRP